MIKKLFCLLFAAFSITVTAQNDIRLPQRPDRPTYSDHQRDGSGFWCAAELAGGSTVTVNKPNMQPMELSFTAGYRVNEYMKVGAGIGGMLYVHGGQTCRNNSSNWTFPVFAHIRGNLMSGVDRDIVPFYSFSVGMALRDGYFIQPSLGLRFGSERNAFTLALSYQFRDVDEWETNLEKQGIHVSTPSTRSMLLLRLGYEF